jgi:hypothetical protein
MSVPASHQSTCLPLSWRLRRVLLVALILSLWAPFKIVWEQEIGQEQNLLRYHGVPITRQLRDELGQGLTIGVLSGMRSVVADLIWVIDMSIAWQNQEWFKMGGYINLCTSLQPRSTVFWDIGGWHLAWNASVAAAYDRKEPNELRRLKASRFWIEKGREIYVRGIENNPTYWRLYADTAQLYYQRLHDYRDAAVYYQQASELPNAPVYLERFPAIMYGMAGDNETAYATWKALWERLTPQQRAMKEHARDKIEGNIRLLEQNLSIPKEKRVFPN